MKAWLKWLANTDYKFTVEHREADECRVYDFGNGLIVYKWEHKNGGLVYDNHYQISCGSVKQLAGVIDRIIADKI